MVRFASLLALLSVTWCAFAQAATPTLAPSALHAGDHAVVRTVLRGDSVSEFEAEIVGVMSNGRVDGDMIIARATSEQIKATGIAAGMSGSPVYVDGRLIGALSSGWPFSREPLFGITPIGEMLGVLDLPQRPASGPGAGPSGIELATAPGGVRFGEFRWDDGPGSGDSPAPAAPPGALAALPLPLACAGLQPALFESARRSLEPLGLTVVPGGSAPDGGPDAASLQPGSAVAVDVLRGDLQLSAIGTVTWREGDRVLIFGHPFFQAGDVRLPLSTARITTIVASQVSSFKLGVRGREVGVATQDRRPAVAGLVGPRARMLPFGVSVMSEGRPAQRFRFEVIQDRGLAPPLVGLATTNGLLESGGSAPNQTLRWTLTLHRPGAPPLTLSDLVGGEAPVGELQTAITGPLQFLFNNPFSRLELDSLDIALRVEPGREQWTLRSARILESAVRPGGVAHVEFVVERWRGGRETRRFEVPVDEELPPGGYLLWLGGGGELARYEATRLPARYRPTSLDDAWRRLATMRTGDTYYAAIFASAPEVTADGRDYPELPASAAAVLASGLAAGESSRAAGAASFGETKLAMPGVARGELRLTLIVDNKAP